MRVGLLGGSFNPPHEGHLHISLLALQALQLDALWWLVTPQNPMKEGITPLPLEERVELSKDLVDHPKILISDLEKELETTTTYQTVRKLKKRFSATEFVWINGMDNALTLHQWNDWRELLSEVCMANLTRRPTMSLVQNCPARMLSKHRNVVIDKGGRYPLDSGLSYWLLQKKMVDVSSTELRGKTT